MLDKKYIAPAVLLIIGLIIFIITFMVKMEHKVKLGLRIPSFVIVLLGSVWGGYLAY
jgi:hypothetical protein